MKRLAIPVLALMLIFGMNKTTMALDDGTYDYYGTFYFDPRTADGSDTCAAEQFNEDCPITASFCITNLVVATDGGTQTITGPDAEPYGVAVESILLIGGRHRKKATGLTRKRQIKRRPAYRASAQTKNPLSNQVLRGA